MRNKAKRNRIQIILECLEQKQIGINGISRYFTTKNRINTPRKFHLRKFNPFLRRVTLHKEI
ncbi:50S ribosomal protein L33 [Candidatus Karelsulcia muelleri]